MQLCYIYIYRYRILENIGIRFDPNYTFECNGERLDIKTCKRQIPENFWGDNISCVSTIIGENGAGKTTLLELLYYICVDGFDSRDADVLIAYKCADKLRFYVPKTKSVEIFIDDVCFGYEKDGNYNPHDRQQGQPKMISMYYTGHFSPYHRPDYPRDVEYAGGYNMSDGYLLVKDLQDYANVDSNYLNNNLGYHLQAHIAQDDFRIGTLLLDDNLRKVLSTFNLPTHLIVKPNMLGWTKLRNHKHFIEANISNLCPDFYPSKQEVLVSFIYYNFLNYISETGDYVALDYLSQWQDFWKKNEDTLEQFNWFLDRTKGGVELVHRMKILASILNEVQSHCQFSDNYGCFYINVKNSPEDLKDWMHRVYFRTDYLVARYYDIAYSRSDFPFIHLSSGELAVLKLYSRLYYTLRLDFVKACNLEPAKLLLIDEAELAFHPEWQRQFINSLVEFVNKVLDKKDKRKVQIILSSHSPLILSDFPSRCVNLLRKKQNDDGTTKTVIEKKDDNVTFGANLYDLYKQSYFLQSSIGEYAQKKIRKLYEIYNLEDKEKQKMEFNSYYSELEFTVSSIADPFIAKDARNKFYQLCLNYNRESLKSLLEREIAERQDILDVL